MDKSLNKGLFFIASAVAGAAVAGFAAPPAIGIGLTAAAALGAAGGALMGLGGMASDGFRQLGWGIIGAVAGAGAFLSGWVGVVEFGDFFLETIGLTAQQTILGGVGLGGLLGLNLGLSGADKSQEVVKQASQKADAMRHGGKPSRLQKSGSFVDRLKSEKSAPSPEMGR